MLSQIKRFVGDSLIYALMSLSTKIIAFFMMPFYSRYLTEQEYGALFVIDSTLSIISFLVIFGTDSALAYYYIEEKDLRKKEHIVQNVMAFRLLVAAGITFCFIVFGYQIARGIGVSNFTDALQISMLTLILDTVNVLVLTILRYDLKSVKVALLTVAKMSFIALFAILFIMLWDQSLNSLMYARLLSVALVGVFAIKESVRFLRLRFDKDTWKEILKYAAPLVPASLAFWVIGSSNRYIIQFFEGEQIGQIINAHFGAAFSFSAVISLFTYGIQMAWRPYSMKIKDRDDAKELFAKVYMAILAVGLLAVLAVTTISPWLMLLMDQAFWGDYVYVGFLTFANFLNFYYLIVTVGMFIKKKTRKVSIAFIIASLLYIIMNIFLYPILGVWGIVLSNNLTYLFVVFYLYSYSQSIYHIPASAGKMLFLILQAAIAVGAINYVQEKDFSWLFIVGAWLYFLVSLLIIRNDCDFNLKPKTRR